MPRSALTYVPGAVALPAATLGPQLIRLAAERAAGGDPAACYVGPAGRVPASRLPNGAAACSLPACCESLADCGDAQQRLSEPVLQRTIALLSERAALLRYLAGEARGLGQDNAATRFGHHAQEAETQAEHLRQAAGQRAGSHPTCVSRPVQRRGRLALAHG
jgi:hypothetical protein